MSILRKAYTFSEGSQLIGFLEQAGADLLGEIVIPEEDTGIQNYFSGRFALQNDPITDEKLAVFEPSKVYEDECPVISFTQATVALDGLGYVRSRRALTT